MRTLCIVCAAVAATALAEVREVTFQPGEVPTENPRIERRGNIITHVEVFGAFETQEDGSVKTRVIESAGDIPQGGLADFVTTAQQRMAVYPTWESIAVAYSNMCAAATARVERVTAALDERRAEYVQKRDAAALPTTKAIYQAFIDAIDRIKESLKMEGGQ